MQKLSLDPVIMVAPELQQFRDSVQLDFQKLQDYVNLLQQSVNPTGAILGLQSATVPPGYLLLDGSVFSATTYPELATYLGGTTLPDYRGRFLVGVSPTDTEYDTVGEIGGSKTTTAPHTHAVDHDHGSVTSASDSPNHGHTVDFHDHGGGTGIHAHAVISKVATNTGSGHIHNGGTSQLSSEPSGSSYFTNDGATNNAGVANTSQNPGTSGVSSNHGHAVDLPNYAGGSGASSVSAAAGNLPPFKAVNWFIKT